MVNHVLIKRGGYLEGVEKHYIKAVEKTQFRRTNITNELESYLYKPCLFEENLTLSDIFCLVSKHIEFFEKIFPEDYIVDFLLEGVQAVSAEDDHRFKYILNLSWLVIHNLDWDELEMSVDFGGLDINDNLSIFSLSFMPLNTIIHCPISMDRAVKIYKGQGYPLEELVSHNPEEKCVIEHIGNKSFTLFDILHGIFNEISFYGAPEERDMTSIEIKERFDSLCEQDI